jgi:hypothetical protein
MGRPDAGLRALSDGCRRPGLRSGNPVRQLRGRGRTHDRRPERRGVQPGRLPQSSARTALSEQRHVHVFLRRASGWGLWMERSRVCARRRRTCRCVHRHRIAVCGVPVRVARDGQGRERLRHVSHLRGPARRRGRLRLPGDAGSEVRRWLVPTDDDGPRSLLLRRDRALPGRRRQRRRRRTNLLHEQRGLPHGIGVRLPRGRRMHGQRRVLCHARRGMRRVRAGLRVRRVGDELGLQRAADGLLAQAVSTHRCVHGRGLTSPHGYRHAASSAPPAWALHGHP